VPDAVAQEALCAFLTHDPLPDMVRLQPHCVRQATLEKRLQAICGVAGSLIAESNWPEVPWMHRQPKVLCNSTPSN
jgi:hypothetical protein